MSKRTLVDTKWFYNENITNLVAIHPEDKEFSMSRQIRVHNKSGSHVFDCALGNFVPRGAIALNSYQRKQFSLKKYRSYYVEAHVCNNHHTMASLLNNKFNFRSKVGGADDVFEQLGDLLLPHLYPHNFVSQTGMHKPRGVLLSGPPGTGKTLIARIICEMLNVRPKIIRGPEIFSRYLGESEEKVRGLFADARRDQKALGNDSPLHVIIFDELDSICKRRTNNSDESTRDRVQDNVTTQLLTEIDGPIPLDNILIIGTTNMLENIEPALLRPGRIYLVIEMQLPSETARLSIFDIHTNKLIRNGFLKSDVSIENIIRGTNGLTGAHIEKIVRLAIINAMRRDVLARGRLDISDTESENLRVENADFTNALLQIRSAEGANF